MTKVLIAEDDQTLRSAYKTKLTLEGMDVETAVDGEEALKKANEWAPDIILLDLMMPKMSGIDFLKAYDILTVHTNVKVLVFTNLASSDSISEVMKLGATKYLSKINTTPNAIVEEIKDIIKNSEVAKVPTPVPTPPVV